MRRYDVTPLKEDFILPDPAAVSSVFLLAIKDGTIVVAQDKERGWDIPGGHLEPGETVQEALRREAREEAGIVFTDVVPVAMAKDDGSWPQYAGKAMYIFATHHYSLSDDFVPADDVADRATMKVEDFLQHYQGDQGTMRSILAAGGLAAADCVYCTLPEIEARTFARNDLARAFLTNIPITPRHTLIVPLRHVAKAEDLTDAEHAAVRELVVRIKTALMEKFGAQGFNYAWNEGPAAGQSIPHFHLHIVPRTPGDEGITEYEPRKFLYRPGSREATPEAELDAAAEEMKRAMG